jgi:hypothetical protein
MRRFAALGAVVVLALAITNGCSGNPPAVTSPAQSATQSVVQNSDTQQPAISAATAAPSLPKSTKKTALTIQGSPQPGSPDLTSTTGSSTYISYGATRNGSVTAALLEVSQGATVAIQWYCITTSGAACPSGAVSTWSATAPSDFTVTFVPTSTTGSTLTTEYFTTDTNTPPGLYEADACLTVTNYSQPSPACAFFLIDVVANSSTPLPSPSAVPDVDVQLQISTAGEGSFNIPGAGHLYVEVYYSGVPAQTLQAGCHGCNLLG